MSGVQCDDHAEQQPANKRPHDATGDAEPEPKAARTVRADLEELVEDGHLKADAAATSRLVRDWGADAVARAVADMSEPGGVLTFPWKRYEIEDPGRLLANIPERKPRTYLGKFHAWVHDDDDYWQADIVTDYYQEEMRLSARRCDERQSPLEAWRTSRGARERVARGALRQYERLDSHSLRESAWKCLPKECTQFKCTLACAVYQKFQCQRAMDISAGWGDRLLGAIASGCVKRYTGFDPNAGLRQGHEQMALAACKGDAEAAKNFRVIYEPFQTAVFPAGETYDLVFTSPPFFDFELYSDLPGQSVAEFPQFNDWAVSFLFASLRRAWGVLEQGGHLALHISDTKAASVCEVMNLFIQARLAGSVYEGVLASRGAADMPRPIWVWRKDDREVATGSNLGQN
eukprot:m51a1_g2 hypothetical protein (403) ;mRNA; r:6477-8052